MKKRPEKARRLVKDMQIKHDARCRRISLIIISLCATLSTKSHNAPFSERSGNLQKWRRGYFYQLNVSLWLIILISPFAACVQREMSVVNQSSSNTAISASAVDLNTATLPELETLPHIGAVTARKIIDYREKYGKFQRIEEIMLIEKMSEKHFRGLRELIKIE